MIDSCSWDNPGASPYRGSARAAIAQMPIPMRVQGYLIARAQKNEYDDVVTITRDSIEGWYDYSSQIRHMIFAKGKVCRLVSRNRWRETQTERAMVFCEERWCVARPSVCNNWFLITRLGKLPPLTALPPLEAGPEAPLIPPVTFEREPEKPSFAAPPETFAGPPDTFEAGPPLVPVFFGGGGGPIFVGGGGGGFGFVVPGQPSAQPIAPSVPIAPIPELPRWLYFVTGLGLMALLMRGWRRRP